MKKTRLALATACVTLTLTLALTPALRAEYAPDFSTYLGGSGNDLYPAVCTFGDDAILAVMTGSTSGPPPTSQSPATTRATGPARRSSARPRGGGRCGG